MKPLKNTEILKIKKSSLKEIEKYMEAYSENGNLYDEFGIQEDVNLYTFDVAFDNGYSCLILINSGQCNCYIDYIVRDANYNEISAIIGEDSLCDGDIIEFDVDDEHFEIKIKAI